MSSRNGRGLSVRMVKYDQPIMKLLPGAPEPSYHLQAMEGPGECVAPEHPQTNTNRIYLFSCFVRYIRVP